MWPNPQFSADLAIFTEEILNGKLHFLCGDAMINVGLMKPYAIVKFIVKQMFYNRQEQHLDFIF